MRSVNRFVGVLCSLSAACLIVVAGGCAGGPGAAPVAKQAAPAVQVWNETKVLPTYPVGRPSEFPDLSRPRGQQSNPLPGLDLYPYTAQRELSFDRRDQSYRTYVLQNEYLRIEVMPDLGGRMFSMLDRVTGQDVVYRQGSIKPALVALRGAWISGGIEWDFPRSHSVTTFDTVSCQTMQYPDGSASIIIGDTERIWHMSWTVELRLRPGQARVETHIICRNATSFGHDGYWWSNAGIPADDQLQFIYPFNKVTGHEAQGATDWPILDGKDMSWYKDYPSSTSTFRAAGDEDFIVGYDHGRDIGLAQFADHNVMPGRKWYSWGTGQTGQRWANILSDDNRPYVEIQSGCPLTQSQQFHMQPHEEKQFLEYWMPVTRIGPPARVNPDCALRLTVDKDVATVGVLPTRAINKARIEVFAEGRLLKQWQQNISPKDIFKGTAALDGANPESVWLRVFDAAGKEVIAHHYGHYAKGPLLVEASSRPTGSRPSSRPGAGSRPSFQPAEQAGATSRPGMRPVDPEVAKLNAAIAQIGLNQFAAARQTLDELTNPKVVEADTLRFYRALTDARLDRRDEALRQWDAIQTAGLWRDAAAIESAKLLLSGGQWAKAIAILKPLADRVPCDVEATAYTALAWRQLKQPEKVRASLRSALQRDPLSLVSQTEQALIEGKDFSALSALRDEERRIEDATIYMAIKQYDIARRLLRPEAKTASSATAIYLSAYLAELMGDAPAAALLRQEAAGASVRGCMPSRSEELAALEAALRANDKDANAHYLTGLVLISRGRKDDAITHWRQAVALGHNDAVVYCCLGDALRDQTPQEAAKLYERAGQLAPNAPEVYADLDFAYTQLGEPAKRVEVLEKGLAQLPTRDELAQRLGVAYFDAGKCDEAIGCYQGHRFHISEGQRDLHDNYAIALVGRAMAKLASGQNAQALADLDAALEYPENMGVGRPERGGNNATIQYWRGVALGRLGRTDEAAKAWHEAANPVRSPYMGRRMGMSVDYALQTVHTILALRTLGKDSQADDLARQALEGGRRMESFDPSNGKVNALIVRGYLAAADGQADEAAKLLDEAQATPSRSLGYVRLVRLWMELSLGGNTTQPAPRVLMNGPVYR